MRIEPYRLLFPMGLVFGFCGALVWVLFGLWALFDIGDVSVYPSAVHADLMAGGFLFCFVAGFLMTAVPRFFGSPLATGFEKSLALALTLLLLAAGFRESRLAFHILLPLGYGLLGLFYVRRFRSKTFKRAPEMLFVEMGLACGLAGSSILAFRDLGLAGEEIGLLGKKLYSQGMILGMILGVGSRLLPAVLGWKEPLPLKPGVVSRISEKALSWILAGSLALSFGLEALFDPSWGRALRAAVATFVAMKSWRVHRRGINTVRLSYWTRVSAIMLVLGLWLQALVPSLAVHMLHAALVSGIALLILMMAAMVVVSHGGHDMGVARDSLALWGTGLLSLLAAATRVAAPMTPSYVWHLLGAALFWIAALGVWTWAFLPKILRVRGPS